jgi:hypothetical protein
VKQSGNEARGFAAAYNADCWIRLAYGVAALVLGALAYCTHFRPELPWWRWTGELGLGSAFLGLALHKEVAVIESRRRRALRIGAGIVALLAGLWSVVEIPRHGHEMVAGIAVTGALVAFAIARWRPFAAQELQRLVPASHPSADRRHPIAGAVSSGAGVVLGVAAAAVNTGNHLGGFLLWLASLGCFALGARMASPRMTRGNSGWNTDRGPPLSRASEAMGMLLLLGLAVALRLLLLDQFPRFVELDEARHGRYAEEMWGAGFPNLFGLGWNVFPNLSYAVGYVGVQLWGDSMANLRLSYAVVGVLSLVPVFYWAKRWWGNVVALIAVAVMATNHDHVYFSRIAFNNIHQVLVAGLVLAAFARVVDERRPVDWVWLGYAAAIGFHTYHAAKLFPLLLVVPVVVFAIGAPGFVRQHARAALFGAVAFLLCLGPLTLTMYHEWTPFFAATSNRTDLSVLAAAYRAGDVEGIRQYVYGHVVGCLYSLISIPDFYAFLDSIPCVLFLLGILWMCWNWRDPRHVVALSWLGGSLFAGGMITWQPPSIARVLGILPVISVVPAVVAGRLRGLLHRCAAERADVIVAPALLVCLAATLYQSWQAVFVRFQARSAGSALPAVCSVLERIPPPLTMYVAGAGVGDLTTAPRNCMMPPDAQRRTVSLANDADVAPLPPAHHGNAVLLVMDDQAQLVPLIRHYYPQAKYELLQDNSFGPPVLHFLELDQQMIESRRGLSVIYETDGRAWPAPTPQDVLEPPKDTAAPVSGVATGLVWISPPGPYRFRADGSSVRVDGRSIDPDSAIPLAAGWHGIEVHTQWHGQRAPVQLAWLRPGADHWTPIGREFLFAHAEVHGLLGRYFARTIPASSAAPIPEVADFAKIDTALSFDLHGIIDQPTPAGFGARPSTMEWTGTIRFAEGDTQEVRLESTAATQVFVDGKEVASTTAGPVATVVERVLPGVSGTLPILVRSTRQADEPFLHWTLRLQWRAPGGEWSAFVPYTPAALDEPSRAAPMADARGVH